MDMNADFSKRATVHASTAPWVPSPIKGVERRMLDRMGDEVARATTIVRYAPGSSFSAHTHTGGEEYLVIDGVFQDEHGDFPVGTYVRNPPQSKHTPRAHNGATILVKLWQFDPEDRHQMSVDTLNTESQPVAGRDGASEIALYSDDRENVRVEIWEAGSQQFIKGHKGLEVFVISGGFSESGEQFETESWLRLPVGADFDAHVGSEGARVWIKSDHLGEDPKPPAA